MAKVIRIGHASTDTPSSGSAADEVRISNFYDLSPDVVLRPKSATLAEASAAACEAGCNNNKIEYSQGSRDTLYVAAKNTGFNLSAITTRCFADCSSFMTVCAIAGGSKVSYYGKQNWAPTCGDMRDRFLLSGDYKAITASKYLTGTDYLKRGDILVRERYLEGSRHTVMVLDNGDKVSDNEVISTLLASVSSLKVTADIINITTNAITIAPKLLKIENGVEKLIKDTNSAYKWDISITTPSGANVKASTKMSIDKMQKMSINGLSKNSCYKLNIIASEIDSTTKISSAPIIFSTATDPSAKTETIKLTADTTIPKINTIYIDVDNSFKSAILHHT